MPFRRLYMAALFVLFTAVSAQSFSIVPAESEARYRVREQLANLSFPNDAVGVTNAVSGTISFDEEGNVLEGSSITVDVSTLRSDQSRRDNFIRGNTLQTQTFPNVVFVPTEIRNLPTPLPTSGETGVVILGDLTIRNVTRPALWTGLARFNGNTVTLEAATAFTFADFSLVQPRVSIVLSVEDTIGLEVDLTLVREE